MNYYPRSFKSRSYWAYALLSWDSLKTFVAFVAGIWTFVDILSDLAKFDKKALPLWLLIPLILVGFAAIIITRRPVKKVAYKSTNPEVEIEVIIDDFFKVPGQKVISTNTTFDTEMANDIISDKTLQGQFTQKYYNGNLSGLDREIERQLAGRESTVVKKNAGKLKRYDFGETIKFKIIDDYFYWFAMADMNEHNIAKAKLQDIEYALVGLWNFIRGQGEKLDIVIPIIGSGRGRNSTSKKKMIAIIAQSFITASDEYIFADKLTIVVYPPDADRWQLNLFEVKDLLRNYLP